MIKTISKLKAKLNKLQREYNELQKEFEQYKKESIKWSIEDFLEEAEKMRYEITKEQAQEALEEMIYTHDAMFGISWDDVRHYVTEYGKPKG